MTENLYDVLGVSKSASLEEIKKSYKKLAMKHHPDRGGDQEKFKKINEAYSVLSDDTKKQHYDRFGTVDMNNMEMPDMGDLFGAMFGNMQGGGGFPFGGMPGMGGMHGMPGMSGMPGMPGMGGNRKGPSRNMQLDVTLEEVMVGSTVPFRILRKKYQGNKKCTGCNGQGHRIQQMKLGIGIMTQSVVECTVCQANGYLYSETDASTTEEVIDVPVPKGIPAGNKLLIRGKADEYPGRETGDIIITIVYKKHPFYRPSSRSPSDVECTIPISLSEFLLGFEKHLLLLDSTTFTLSQPVGKPLAKVLSGPSEKVIPHRGFSYKHQRGSLVVRFEVYFPTTLPSSSMLLSSFPSVPISNAFLPPRLTSVAPASIRLDQL